MPPQKKSNLPASTYDFTTADTIFDIRTPEKRSRVHTFLLNLNNMMALGMIAYRASVMNIYPPGFVPSGGGSTSGLTVEVDNTIGAQEGQFVSAIKSTLQFADGTLGIPATHVVVETKAGIATLASVYGKVDCPIDPALIGDDDNQGNVYLATQGNVTRDQSQIVNSDGSPVNGYVLCQRVGFWTTLAGAVASGYLRTYVQIQDGQALA